MNVEIKVDKSLNEPKVVIYTNELTEEISSLFSKLSYDNNQTIFGFHDSEILLLNRNDILRFYTENQKIFAQTNDKTVRVKSRLCELEELLKGTSFVRISNSEIVNFDKILSLDLSMAGTITLKFKNGCKTYVSRRYVGKIKQYLKL